MQNVVLQRLSLCQTPLVQGNVPEGITTHTSLLRSRNIVLYVCLSVGFNREFNLSNH